MSFFLWFWQEQAQIDWAHANDESRESADSIAGFKLTYRGEKTSLEIVGNIINQENFSHCTKNWSIFKIDL